MENNKNFELLKDRWPELHKHAGFAETYIHNDPPTAIIKLRCFLEALVGFLYRDLRLSSEPSDGLYEKLKSQHFESVVENPIRQKMHAIRCHGNKAAHGKEIDNKDAIHLLKDAYLLGRWVYTTYNENFGNSYPDFVIPQSPEDVSENLNAANESLIQQLEDAKKDLEHIQTAQQETQSQISNLNSSMDDADLSEFRGASSRASNSMDLQEENTRQLLKIEDSFAKYKLTDGQTELVRLLGNFLLSSLENSFLLRGYAGTGKTFITKGLTEYFRSIGRNYVLAAPTGKAAKVIAKKTNSLAYTIHKTIYSLDKLSEYKDEDIDGTETYKFYAELSVNELPADTVYIVDEASMLSDVYNEMEFFRFGSGYLLRDFLKYVNLDHNDHRKKVIFIGDDAQLPPIGMNYSPALDANFLFREYNLRPTSYELMEVVRQKAESGVMANSITLRNALKKDVFNQLSVDYQFPDVARVEHSDLIERYIESCGGKINDESIIIAYSNSDVAAYNRRVREHFFPSCLTVTAGDKVMAVSNSTAHGFFISNGDFGLIKQVLGDSECRTILIKRKNHDTGKVESINIPLVFHNVKIGFRDHDGNARFFEAKILEHLLYNNNPSLDSDENKAMYVDFCIRHPQLRNVQRNKPEFKNTLKSDPYFNALRLKFGYAITCHKAQGSEWNSVFVKCSANQNQLTSNYFRWFYTAITRTSSRLYLLDPPAIKLGAGIKAVTSPNIPTNAAFNQPSFPQELTKVNKTAEERSDLTVDTFGIPSNAHFSLEILKRIRGLIVKSEINIQDVSQGQYQEIYFFQKEDKIARIDISYNGKGKISRITTPKQTELSLEIIELISQLKGTLVVPVIPKTAVRFDFEEEFLNDFHKRLHPLVEHKGITIINVESMDWKQRYSFIQSGESAVFDIFYNGKNRFTKCAPVKNACSSNSLCTEILAILTEGLNS
jgi:ATP-dependent exoDNAse (exonuclease V) alpha subunit